MELRIISVLLLVCAGCAATAHAQVPNFADRDGGQTLEQVARWTANRLQSGEFEAVDAALQQFGVDSARSMDGLPLLSGVAEGIVTHCGRSPVNAAALSQLRAWRRSNPESVAGVLVESCFWRESAWTARGPGMAGDVTDEGARLFAERLQLAWDLLDSGAAVGQRNPRWYVDAMETQLGLGASPQLIEATFRDGKQRFAFYDGIYLQMARTYLPQWHGSPATIAPMMTRILQGLPQQRADALYARMWLLIQGSTRADMYQLGADWGRLQKGLRALISLYPRSNYNRSLLLAMACHARDDEAYRTMRASLDGEIAVEVFRWGVTLDECDERWAPAYSRAALNSAEFAADKGIRSACGSLSRRTPVRPDEVRKLLPRLIEARRALRDYYRSDSPDMAASLTDNLGFLERVDANDAQAICDVVGYEGM